MDEKCSYCGRKIREEEFSTSCDECMQIIDEKCLCQCSTCHGDFCPNCIDDHEDECNDE